MASSGERYKDLPSHLLTDLPENWRFNLLLDTIGNNIDDGELLRLKDFESGPGGIGRRLYEEIKKPRDFFRYLAGRLMLTRDNILHLQAMLWHLGRQDLLRKCVDYAKTETDTLYFYQPSPEPANGYRYAVFHVEGKDLSQYRRDGLEQLRTLVSNRLAVPPEFVFICGLEPSSSLMVTIMIPVFHAEIFVELLKENSISELLELGIDSVHINGETFNLHGFEDVEMVETTGQANIVKEYEKLKKTEALLEQREIEVLRLTRELIAARKTLHDTGMAQQHKTQNGNSWHINLLLTNALTKFNFCLRKIRALKYDTDVITDLLEAYSNFVAVKTREEYELKLRNINLQLALQQIVHEFMTFSLIKGQPLTNSESIFLMLAQLWKAFQPGFGTIAIRTQLGDEISQILREISNKLTDEDTEKLKSTFAWSSDEDALLLENGSHFLEMMVQKEIMRRQKLIDVGMYIISLLEGIKRDDLANVVRTKLTDLNENKRGEKRVNSQTLKQPMDKMNEDPLDEQPVLRRLDEITISIRKLEEKLDTLLTSRSDTGDIFVDVLEGYQRLKTSFVS
ncbi:hypothetical protein CHS0354_020287 [Potamilus streckersoni]|uniref:DED domain-containing protein n=1 Tax=Potamilus streckersoni TaxID=2493646 RepID=A0AAE0VPR9_9BIVA|nr:hypothetical protein CHS0354_020287 [Potamilus streckersoni]